MLFHLPSRFVLCALAVSSALAVSACSGGGGNSVPSAAKAAPAARGRASATFTITIPKATASTLAARRSPKYVSPATTSMTIDVTTDPGGVSVLSETVPLTPTSSGCSSSLASTVCVLTLSLNPGDYDAVISTYDGSSVELSAGQDVDFTVAQGQQNAVALVLNGIPAAIRVASSAPAVHGAQNSGFTLYGLNAQNFAAEAIDADGNVIVGAGSPTFSVASVVGSGFTITAPTTTAPNTFGLTPPGTNGQGATFTVTAAYSDSTCATAGAVCTATFTVKNDVQTLFIAGTNPAGVEMYTAPFTGAPTTLVGGSAGTNSLAISRSGDLFVGNIDTDIVSEYAPPYTGAPIASTTAGDIGEEGQIALDASGNLFVADEENNAVDIFAPPYSGAPTVITNGVNLPITVVVDAAGNFYVGNLIGGNVEQFTPPYSSLSLPAATIATGAPIQLALDRTANLFVGDGSIVNMYSPPYTSGSTIISTDMAGPQVMALDGTGTLFVPNDNGPSSSATIYTAPYTGTPQIVHGGLFNPMDIAIDGTGTMYVANASGPTPGLYVFAPPYTGTPTINTNGSWTSTTSMVFTP